MLWGLRMHLLPALLWQLRRGREAPGAERLMRGAEGCTWEEAGREGGSAAQRLTAGSARLTAAETVYLH